MVMLGAAKKCQSLRVSPRATLSPITVDRDRSTIAKSLTPAAMSLGYGVVQLDVTIVNTALSSIGASLGGGLIALVGWRSIFLVNLPIGLAGIWLTWRYANETARSPLRQIDLAGQVAAVGALGCLAGAIIQGGALGWSSPRVQVGFAGFAVLSALFVLQERRAPQPMLPLSLFKNNLFSLTSLVGLLVNVAFYGLIFVLSLYFQQVNGLSPFATGLAFLPIMGVVLPVNLLAARAAERIGAPAVIAGGASLAAAGCIALMGIERDTSYWAIAAQLVAMGSGLGLLVPPLTSTLLGSVAKTRSGVAAGVLNSAR